ncbi:EEF1AKNMT [Symbiodinium sp. CCMP2592]|nr:EEF1AKNMT [Symbiodinium sp. CCMP2592]
MRPSSFVAPRSVSRIPRRAQEGADPMLSYQNKEYWERRYSTGDKGVHSDIIDDRGVGWLCTYAGPVRETLNAITGGDRSKVVLNIGCGMDQLSPDIYKDGYTNLLSSDISQHAISEMQEKTAAEMPLAKWFVDDVTKMTLPDESVDIVVDKGTLDAVLIQSEPFVSAARMLKEVQRVLKEGGIYFLITHGRGDPDTWRLPVLTLPHLGFNIAKTPDMGGYFIFVCTKLAQPEDAVAAAKWKEALATLIHPAK